MNKEKLLQAINEYQKLEESVEQLKGEVKEININMECGNYAENELLLHYTNMKELQRMLQEKLRMFDNAKERMTKLLAIEKNDMWEREEIENMLSKYSDIVFSIIRRLCTD